ncbi:hypothetical protein [Phenylobacterium sp. NIBR 498073]|uniref:hypothetical protein n=1 Tax=Phenylobacterium sp. NIBR 498073 TaxID=3015177 RepID=UPI0022B2B687|nr:hypothetical protein [Phenylobacterium sp. NIBR 498073]WGU40079.1 hypothetical protein O4N75_20970 [Phenylobacterium sp. NIBR 498073]
MNQFLRSAIGLLALAAASAAQAQDVVDPIGSILDQVDEETAETLGAPPPAAPAPEPAPAAAPAFPYSPAPAPPPAERLAVVSLPPAYAPPPPPVSRRPRLTAPVTVDEYDKTPEAPLNAVELGYESRLRSSFASAQGMQGPMDGAWVLRTRSGETLYSFLLVDKGGGTLEGAWRDPRRRGSPDASGFLVDIQRVGSQVTASFYPRPGAGVATLMLNPVSGGEWSGDLLEGRDRTAVTLRRN